jgi:CHAT domain-containing protein
MDEKLLSYPWELMYDGEFFCLQHRMGRVVNSAEADPAPAYDEHWQPLEQMGVLLIEVSRTERRDDYQHAPLKQAEIEADAIQTILQRIGIECVHLKNEHATHENVVKTLFGMKKFKIIHFCGHAQVDRQSPENSNLILYNKPLMTEVITLAFGETRPILCFINACQSASEDGPDPHRRSVYTIGRSFLQTGAYVLGTRWKIDDCAAKVFAEMFYTSLLQRGQPIGEAVRVARLACKDQVPHDLGWASYVYYGDPRIRFKSETGRPTDQVPALHSEAG